MRSLIWSVFIIVLVMVLGNGIFAQKPNLNNKHLEFDNLKMDEMYKTISGKVSKESRVARYVYNENYGPLMGTAEQQAKLYLNKHAAKFGIEDVESQLQVAHVVTSPGGKHVTFNQYLNGYPVFRSEMVVTINKENTVSFVSSNFRPNLNVDSFTKSVSSARALSLARNYLNVSGKLLGVEKSELMIFDSKDNGAQLAYRVQIPTENPMGDWEIFVNAQTGKIIHVKDRMMYNNNKASGGGVAWDPDPLTTAGVYYGGQYTDIGDADNDSLNNQRTSVVLQDLTFSNGVYSLEGPYCVLNDWESPSDNFPQLADSTGFNYTRSQQEFEDVMVYFHIDSSYRWLMSMGYDIPGLYNFSCDPHGLSGADNSHYVPGSNYCAWGEGGVDDAEDAAVIWHEYGHAIQENIPPSMSYSGETQSLQEGSSDYWAASYSRSLYDFGWGVVFIWDGGHTNGTSPGTIWPGRHCDLDWVYPNDYVSGHDGGQIWSSALMKMWPELGRAVTDNLFIQAHYLWGSSPGLEDAAQAFIQADRDLFGGSHLSTIVNWFDFHGLVDATLFIPQLTHSPLTDTEDLTGPYTVEVEIVPATAPLDTANLFVYWGLDGLFTDSLLLQSTGVTNQYSADIPGTGTAASVNYYISVVDTANNLVYHPANAPLEFHSFYVGADTIAPVITHAPLRDQAYIRWPANVTANITDNLGIADATVNYYVNDIANTGTFQMMDQGNGSYLGTFDIDTTSVSVGDSIFYRITATDNSSSSNITNDPMAGFHQFFIIDAKGVVLIIDDDVSTKTKVTGEKGTYSRDKGTLGVSSNNMERWLTNLGYVAEQVNVATSLIMNWDEYSIVINASGGNQSPISDAAYRTKWETYVSNSVHKYLIEGGEVGYDAASSPGYPTFATNVLHSDDWNGDDSGTMNLIPAFSGHPLVNIPNTLPSALTINYSGYGDQDAQLPLTEAVTIYETNSDPGNAGVMIYDDNPNPLSAQMAYFAFNFGVLTDSVVAMNLLENTLEFLLNPETAAIGQITGNVDLTDTANDSGVVVYLVGFENDTTITDSNGDYLFAGLYNGFYSVSTGHTGYFPYSAIIDSIEVADNTVSGNNFVFDPIVTGSVSGTVSLSDTTQNVFASILVVSQNTVSDTTDGSGNYSASGVMPGNIRVFAIKDGYVSTSVDTFLTNDGSNLQVDFMLYPGTNSIVFDFENNNGGFAGSGSWEWGTPGNGPGSAYQGTNLWATSLSGDYGSGENSELITPEINLSGFTNPKLSFAHWYDIEENSSTPGNAWDGGNVKISTDGGSTFTLIDPLGGYPYTISTASNVLNGQGVYSATSIGWELAEFDLTAYAGMNILLKLHFGTDGSVQLPGWYVDSLVISNEIPMPQAPANLTVLDSLDIVTLGWNDVTKNLLNQVPYTRQYQQEDLAIKMEKDQNNGNSILSLENDKTFSFNIYKSTDGTNYTLTGTALDTTFTDSMVTVGNTYYYYVTKVMGPLESEPSNNVSVTVGTVTGIFEDWGKGIPITFAIEQNYPNPFNPVTTIRYQLPEATQVKIEVFTITGKKVKTLVNAKQSTNYYTIQWNGLNEVGGKVASGVYLYRIEAGDFIKTNKMLLLK